MEANQTVVFFDGVCNLCNSSVQWIISKDKSNIFSFASLQSSLGQQALETLQIDAQNLQTIILYHHTTYYTKSTAALRIASLLPFPWNVMKIFLVLPASWRDVLYSFIAKNRYRWFGKQNECWIPTPELKSKFLG